jgi:hydrogenase maturation factor
MYDSVSEMVGVCTTYGTIPQEKLITPGNAKPGDLILCTKPVGLETAVNFSLTYKARAQQLFGTQQTEKLSKLVPMQSCVKEALNLAETGGVHAMHDATEGGLVTTLNELAEASQLGFKVELDKIPICSEAKVLQQGFGFSDEQFLAMSSTGTILAAVDPQFTQQVIEALSRSGLQPSFIGKFTKNQKCVLYKNKKETTFPVAAEDPYTRILSGQV